MSDLLFSSLFLIGFIYNLSSFKEIKLRSHLRTLDKLVLGLSSLIFLFIAYISRNDLAAYIISLLVTGFFISGVCLKGLGDKSFFLTIGRGLLVRKLDYDDIEKVFYRNKKGKDYFELKIVSRLGVGYENFKNQDRDRIESFLTLKGL